MTLRELIADAGFDPSELIWRSATARPAGPDSAEAWPDVRGLAYRSESVAPGTLFFCVPGFTADGHRFAAEAIERGAVALVCERALDVEVPQLVVPGVRAAMPSIAAAFHGHPTRELKVVGVTGTNGKTTTTFLLREILEAAGVQTALLGTVQSVVGGVVEAVERTTPEAIDLQQSFRLMVESGDAACVMEVSSHALELRRADSIDFDCAVFTNLSLEHLDFHETLEAYFEAKRRLFSTPGVPVSVVNVDDEWGRRLAAELAGGETGLVTFAAERDADLRAENVTSGPAGSRFTCLAGGDTVEVSVPLPGLFNVYNALAALGAARSLGVPLETAAAALAGAGRVPGRFEPIDEGQEFSVVVDYAHTPDSLENVLRASRELLGSASNGGRPGRLVCVFGAGGDRDREKRPLMGEAARRLADHVIVTSDNPRSEDPDAIIAAIVEGAERAAGGEAEPSILEVEPDRRTAIARALRTAGAGDLVVIAGKGHEQGQELAGGLKIPFDDRDVARQELHAARESAGRLR
jgi:UDP-N-acetylmuramoyl-L-alanyl-D-glutamate--2,6-diaminopimelate ligase